MTRPLPVAAEVFFLTSPFIERDYRKVGIQRELARNGTAALKTLGAKDEKTVPTRQLGVSSLATGIHTGIQMVEGEKCAG